VLTSLKVDITNNQKQKNTDKNNDFISFHIFNVFFSHSTSIFLHDYSVQHFDKGYSQLFYLAQSDIFYHIHRVSDFTSLVKVRDAIVQFGNTAWNQIKQCFEINYIPNYAVN